MIGSLLIIHVFFRFLCKWYTVTINYFLELYEFAHTDNFTMILSGRVYEFVSWRLVGWNIKIALAFLFIILYFKFLCKCYKVMINIFLELSKTTFAHTDNFTMTLSGLVYQFVTQRLVGWNIKIPVAFLFIILYFKFLCKCYKVVINMFLELSKTTFALTDNFTMILSGLVYQFVIWRLVGWNIKIFIGLLFKW